MTGGTHRQREERERPVGTREHDEHAAQEEQRGHDGEHGVRGERLDRVRVRGEAIHQVTDLPACVERERQALEMPVQVALQAVHQALTDPDCGAQVREREAPSTSGDDEERASHEEIATGQAAMMLRATGGALQPRGRSSTARARGSRAVEESR